MRQWLNVFGTGKQSIIGGESGNGGCVGLKRKKKKGPMQATRKMNVSVTRLESLQQAALRKKTGQPGARARAARFRQRQRMRTSCKKGLLFASLHAPGKADQWPLSCFLGAADGRHGCFHDDCVASHCTREGGKGGVGSERVWEFVSCGLGIIRGQSCMATCRSSKKQQWQHKQSSFGIPQLEQSKGHQFGV